MSHWVSIVPFLVIIPLAVWTKQVIPALAVGLLAASYIVHPTLLGGVVQSSHFVISNLAEPNNLYIIGFLYIFSGIIQLVQFSGGVKGFAEATTRKIRTRKAALLLIWITVLGTFSAPTLRIVVVTPLVKALQTRIPIEKDRAAFLIEATAVPVLAIMPVATAFIGYMTATIAMSLRNAHMSGNAYHLFIQSVPYNLFALIGLILAFVFTLFGHPRLLHHESAPKEALGARDKAVYEDSHPAVARDLPSRPLNLYLPLLSVVVLTVSLSWWNGYQKTHSFGQALIHSNVAASMFEAIVITLLVTVVLLLVERIRLGSLVNEFFKGGNNLMSAIFLFALVWGLASATEHLGLAQLVAASLGWIPRFLIAPAVFLVGSLFAYFIGSSWGAWGLLMPIAVSLLNSASVALPVLIGVVFASGTFGALVSPFSNNTVTMAKIMDLDIVAYSRYKLRHSMIPLTLSAIGYFLLGLR